MLQFELEKERKRIGVILQNLRFRKGITSVPNFASIAGLRPDTIYSIERGGTYNIDSYLLYKLALRKIIKDGNSYKLKQ